MAVPVRSKQHGQYSTSSSLIDQPAGLGLPVRLRERLGCRGYGRDNSTMPPSFRFAREASMVGTNPTELASGHALVASCIPDIGILI